MQTTQVQQATQEVKVNVKKLQQEIDLAKTTLQEQKENLLSEISGRVFSLEEILQYYRNTMDMKLPWCGHSEPSTEKYYLTNLRKGWFLPKIVENPDYMKNRLEFIQENQAYFKEKLKNHVEKKYKSSMQSLQRIEFYLDVSEEPVYISAADLDFIFGILSGNTTLFKL